MAIRVPPRSFLSNPTGLIWGGYHLWKRQQQALCFLKVLRSSCLHRVPWHHCKTSDSLLQGPVDFSERCMFPLRPPAPGGAVCRQVPAAARWPLVAGSVGGTKGWNGAEVSSSGACTAACPWLSSVGRNVGISRPFYAISWFLISFHNWFFTRYFVVKCIVAVKTQWWPLAGSMCVILKLWRWKRYWFQFQKIYGKP